MMRNAVASLFILSYTLVDSTKNSFPNDTRDDDVHFPHVNLSWYLLPPFTTEDENVFGNSPPGEIISRLVVWLGSACYFDSDYKPIAHLTEGDNETEVLNLLQDELAQFAFPIVSSSKEPTYRGYTYLPLLPYPPTVFLRRQKPAEDVIIDAMFKAWPILAITLLLTAISGIVTWALVSYSDEMFKCLETVMKFCLELDACAGHTRHTMNEEKMSML